MQDAAKRGLRQSSRSHATENNTIANASSASMRSIQNAPWSAYQKAISHPKLEVGCV